MNLYKKYLHAENLLNQGLIRRDLSISRPYNYVKSSHARMDTMREFLRLCNNPQSKIPAIHVAGTSGKGSVCSIISQILSKAGLKVGMHVSPYLQSATEKIWSDGQYAAPDQFYELVEWVMPAAKRFLSPLTPASIHGMASVAIAMEAFRREKVDVMVFEAGCGGRFDLTSFVETEVSVITNVGLDHIVSLGPSLENIAWHKAGIIRDERPVVTGLQGPLLEIVKDEARLRNSELHTGEEVANPLEQNLKTAHRAAELFIERHRLNNKTLPVETTVPKLPGRLEKMPCSAPSVYLDGAHNESKLRVAVDSAKKKGYRGKSVAVVGMLGAKAEQDCLAPLVHEFDHIVTTEPYVYAKTPCKAQAITSMLKEKKIESHTVPEPEKALKKAVELSEGGLILVTGSFYLCGQLRDLWYPREDVVLQRTSWPETDLTLSSGTP